MGRKTTTERGREGEAEPVKRKAAQARGGAVDG